MSDDSDSEKVPKFVVAEQCNVEISRIRRRERLAAMQDYVEFFTRMFAGATLVAVGALEGTMPDLIPLVLSNPGVVTGCGIALIAGPRILSTIAAIRGK